MDLEQIEIRLNTIFADVFADPGLKIKPEMTAHDVPAWDSLAHIDLIVAVEKGFGIRFSTREVRKMQNVGEFIELIATKAP